jgi:predicted DNA-binding protein (UPF0251 family)
MKLDLKRINRERRRRGAKPLPVPAGLGRPAGPHPSKAELVRLYVTKGLSLRSTAEALGASKDTVRRTMAEYKIKPRPSTAPPSRLAPYGLTVLRRRIKADGLRSTARALGLSAPGLLDYLRRHGRKR